MEHQFQTRCAINMVLLECKSLLSFYYAENGVILEYFEKVVHRLVDKLLSGIIMHAWYKLVNII